MTKKTLLFIALFMGAARLFAAAPHVAIIADTSGSMDGENLRALQEGTKLAIALLDGQIVLIQFNDQAQMSASMPLTDAKTRQSAMRLVDQLRSGGRTNYPAALDGLLKLPGGTAAIFISDGANSVGTDEEVLQLVRKATGPIYTIAVDASGKAKKLLEEMAAISGGSAVSVDDAEGLTKALLEVAQRLGRYHAHQPADGLLRFANCHDSVIAIGYDAVPLLTGSPRFTESPFQHLANLGNEQVALSRVTLGVATAIEIRAAQKRTPSGRLARVLRNDLVQPVLQVQSSLGKVGAGGTLHVATELVDRSGRRIHPLTRPDIRVEYELQDANKNVIARTVGEVTSGSSNLQATLPLPSQPGVITVVQRAEDMSSGARFLVENQQTLIAVGPIELVAEPKRVNVVVKRGAFSLRFHVKPADGDNILIKYVAELTPQSDHLKLLKSESHTNELTVELVAERTGAFHGKLLIHGKGALPTAALAIPYDIDVEREFIGLALPENHVLNLGTVVANAGEITFAEWKVPGLDVDDAPSVEVRTDDLASGSTVMSLDAKPSTIRPTKDNPASLTLAAHVGNVAAGNYEGIVTFQLRGAEDGRRWQTIVNVTVSEPLSVKPLDMGKVEVGKTARRKLRIHNAGGPIRDVGMTFGSWTQDSRPIDPNGLTVQAPQQLAVVPGQTETAVEMAITLSPFLSVRGKATAQLSLMRMPQQTIDIPVTIEIVGPGEGESTLAVAPSVLRLTAAPGAVAKFTLRVKLADAAAGLIGIEVESGSFADMARRPVVVAADFVMPQGSKLSVHEPVVIEGFLIAPDHPGSFIGQIIVRSPEAGLRSVSVTLEVK